MLSGNKVDSNQRGHPSWTPSGNASRFALWLLFTFPQCTVLSHVPTLLVFRLVCTSLPNMDSRLNVQQLSGYCPSSLHLALYLPGFCAVVLRQISASGSHCSSPSSSSRALGWIPSSPGLLQLILRVCPTTSSTYTSVWDKSFSMSLSLFCGNLPKLHHSQNTCKIFI